MAPCAPETPEDGKSHLSQELIEIRKLGRARPQPDPISKESEHRPFVQVFVR